MSLPVPGNVVGNALLDVVMKSSTLLQRDKVTSWMNAVGLVLTALPVSVILIKRSRSSHRST